MSSMAGGSVSGHMGRSNDKEEETLIREEL